MAAPTIDPVLTNVTLANDLTNWAGFNDGGGGAGADVLEQDIFIQGTAAVSNKVSGTSQNKGIIYTPGGSVDLSAAANAHVYAWIAFTTQALLNTLATGGLYIRLGDGTNWSKWWISGSDVIDPTRLFVRYVIDTRKTPSEDSGTPCDLTAVTTWAVGAKSTGTSKSENLIVDRIDYGTGLRIEDGDATDPCTWQALFEDDDDINNKYGIVQKRGDTFYLLGSIDIGDTASKTTVWLDDSGAAVEFENPMYHNGTQVVSAVGDDIYGITFQGNGTGTTDITFGQVVGSGDDRQGSGGGSIKSAGTAPPFTIDGETDIADLDSLNFYGMTFTRAGIIQTSSPVNPLANTVSCTFVECGEIQPHNGWFLSNTIINPRPVRGVEMTGDTRMLRNQFIAGSAAARDIGRCYSVDVSPTPDVFTDETPSWLDGSLVTYFPTGQGIGDYFAIGADYKFYGVDLDQFTARTGGVVVWEYWNGSTWAALTEFGGAVFDNTFGFVGSGVIDVRFDAPNDWARTSLDGERDLFYIRVRLTTVFSGSVGTRASHSNVAYPAQHAVHLPVIADRSFDALEFFNFDETGLGMSFSRPQFAIESSAGGTLLESYNESNQDGTLSFASSTVDLIAQEFIGNGGVLSRVRVWMRRNVSLSPGVASCEIYDSDDGSPPEPTGDALAVSREWNPHVEMRQDNEFRYLDFEFDDEFTLVNTQTYFFAVRFTSNLALEVGTDTSSPTAAGTAATGDDGTPITWTGIAGTALAGFQINTGGIITVTGINGSNPTDDEAVETAANAGATIVNTPVTIEITGVTEGARVAMHRLDTNEELINALAYADDGSGGFKASGPFEYGAGPDVAVRLDAASSGKVVAGIAEDIPAFTDETVQANDSRTGVGETMTLLPASAPAATEGFYFGALEKFSQMDLDVLTAGVGTYTIDWRYWNGSGWFSLGGLVDDTDSYKNAGINRVSWNLPGNWQARTVTNQPGSTPLFYVRAMKAGSGTVTTTPVGRTAQLDVTKYRRWEAENTITVDGLSAKATWLVDETATF